MQSSNPAVRTYLGVPLVKPSVALFDFSSCEGCQLQIINNESSLLDFVKLINVVNFREAMTEQSDSYDIAFVEGSVTRADEVERLREIRKRAKVLVAFGSCACFGGVNQLKNRFADPAGVKKRVYGDHAIETNDQALPLDAVTTVDLKIFGCPVKKEEVEKAVMNVALGRPVRYPKYPICMECKANENNCLFDLGEPCLGPITRAGCDSWCPNNRFGCWGCRGPVEDANIEQMIEIMKQNGISEETVIDRLECFGGFAQHAAALRKRSKITPQVTGAGSKPSKAKK